MHNAEAKLESVNPQNPEPQTHHNWHAQHSAPLLVCSPCRDLPAGVIFSRALLVGFNFQLATRQHHKQGTAACNSQQCAVMLTGSGVGVAGVAVCGLVWGVCVCGGGGGNDMPGIQR